MVWQWETKGWMIMNEPLWPQEACKDTGVYLQEPEAGLNVFHGPAHKTKILPGNQEADALTRV